ncbi:protein NLRC3-like isoform X1 [Lates japonicus]|uniref:Protein NLRC3-like isoform X1 n=1 Tax=Lates japonicus TaxID=270547 RepID=A0AAD3M3N2_LATJO|nr:protein NLRC3-like isoform X1 [Lates japonicus]
MAPLLLVGLESAPSGLSRSGLPWQLIGLRLRCQCSAWQAVFCYLFGVPRCCRSGAEHATAAPDVAGQLLKREELLLCLDCCFALPAPESAWQRAEGGGPGVRGGGFPFLCAVCLLGSWFPLHYRVHVCACHVRLGCSLFSLFILGFLTPSATHSLHRTRLHILWLLLKLCFGNGHSRSFQCHTAEELQLPVSPLAPGRRTGSCPAGARSCMARKTPAPYITPLANSEEAGGWNRRDLENGRQLQKLRHDTS